MSARGVVGAQTHLSLEGTMRGGFSQLELHDAGLIEVCGAFRSLGDQRYRLAWGGHVFASAYRILLVLILDMDADESFRITVKSQYLQRKCYIIYIYILYVNCDRSNSQIVKLHLLNHSRLRHWPNQLGQWNHPNCRFLKSCSLVWLFLLLS